LEEAKPIHDPGVTRAFRITWVKRREAKKPTRKKREPQQAITAAPDGSATLHGHKGLAQGRVGRDPVGRRRRE
jgi:hypothetical protein